MLRHSLWLLTLALFVGCGGDAATTPAPAEGDDATTPAGEGADEGASVTTPALNTVSFKVPGMT